MTARPVMPTRILVVGSGAREHALAWKLGTEPGVNAVHVAPGSHAIDAEPRVRAVPEVAALDAGALVDLARREAIELVVIGPEAPLAAGVADALTAAGVPVFGPSAAAARIESSKAYCREIAEAAGVRMARGRAFGALESARAFARDLAAAGLGIVVKADGLAAGKGVTVCESAIGAERVLNRLFAAEPGARVVVEERLEGREASLIVLTDGRAVLALPLARDHKRLRDRDEGPNTGGMGAYSPLPDLADDEIPDLVESIHRPILEELVSRETPFVGALYAGLMLTARGPILLECNARFGDPETQVLLPRLATPLGPLLLAAAQGRLAAAAAALGLPDVRLPVLPGATVGIVLAASGYPDTPRRGDAIEGLQDAAATGALLFHAGTERTADHYATNGGRILTVVARGRDLADARSMAERAAGEIRWHGLQRRRDIGAQGPSEPATMGSAR